MILISKKKIRDMAKLVNATDLIGYQVKTNTIKKVLLVQVLNSFYHFQLLRKRKHKESNNFFANTIQQSLAIKMVL
jgi:hypothetical protein